MEGSSISTKGQGWYLDFIVAMFIFVLILTLFFRIRPNLEGENISALNELQSDAKTLADSLATAGYPYNWTEATVERIGIAERGNVISSSKLASFHNLSQSNYSDVRVLFNMRSDWGVFFLDDQEAPASINGISIIGHPNMTLSGGRVGLDNITYGNLVSLSRILHYNGSTFRMVVYAWQ